MTPYLSPKLEEVLSEFFTSWPVELSLPSLERLCNQLFIYPLEKDKQLFVASDLIRNKSLLKTCFNEKEELTNPAKLSEIIKEILK